jgi:tetratricopeptide (TPR) repeat protein
MKKMTVLYTLLILVTAQLSFSQVREGGSSVEKTRKDRASFFSIKVTPGIQLPLGGSSDLYNLGGGVKASGEYVIPPLPLFFLSGDLGYTYVPVEADTSLSVISMGVGGGINYELLPKLNARVFTSSGVYYGFLSNNPLNEETPSTWNPYLSGGAGIYYFLVPAVSLGLETSYKNYLKSYDGLEIAIGTSYHFGAGGRQPEIEIIDIEFENIFPVFYKYYDDHPVGKASVQNDDRFPIKDLKVTFFVDQYMDRPKYGKAPENLKKGEAGELEFYALFNEKVLDLTEGTKVSAELSVEYSMKGRTYVKKTSGTIRLHGRNSTTWEDDRRAAAFVTAKDPTVLTLAKNIAGLTRERGNRTINENLKIAMAMHEALTLYGINYVVDPTTPYIEYSENKFSVDFLQFPAQTLAFRAGDCDDLSILYAALLESVGIETAFITFPGHLYMAFSLDMPPDEAKKFFSKPEDLIFKDGKTWVPVEITEIKGGFLNAWNIGAKEWREYDPEGLTGFFPTHNSWKVYEPVGFSGKEPDIELPAIDTVGNVFENELARFIDIEIFPRVDELQNEIESSGGNPKLMNKLGVLYARYGLFNNAESEFNRAIQRDETFIFPIMNLGNLYFIQKDPERALSYYERAYGLAPENPLVLLAITRAYHELENYYMVRKTYKQLQERNPQLAEKYAYLGLKGEEAVRAAEIGRVRGSVEWGE